MDDPVDADPIVQLSDYDDDDGLLESASVAENSSATQVTKLKTFTPVVVDSTQKSDDVTIFDDQNANDGFNICFDNLEIEATPNDGLNTLIDNTQRIEATPNTGSFALCFNNLEKKENAPNESKNENSRSLDSTGLVIDTSSEDSDTSEGHSSKALCHKSDHSYSKSKKATTLSSDDENLSKYAKKTDLDLSDKSSTTNPSDVEETSLSVRKRKRLVNSPKSQVKLIKFTFK